MVIIAIYIIVTFCLVIFSLNSLYLLFLFHLNKKSVRTVAPLEDWPQVTVQLPIYNEFNSIEGLLSSVCDLDYPLNRLQIQVLDDSDDKTSILVESLVKKYKNEGRDISHIERRSRLGYKAGALSNGLMTASGEYIAIFDADFIPPRDFLKRTVPIFSDHAIGCIQTRWGHTNRDYSLITKLQAMAIDAHFMVEQTARSVSGLLMNFNGSGGIWRKACIIDSGGWLSRTLTEDLDLSYRAQLRGWKFDYLPDVVVPGELPVQINAYKQQQSRWAQGSLQTARKLLKPLITSKLSIRQKIMGSLHLMHYLVHPLILISIITTFFLQSLSPINTLWFPVIMISILISPLLYLTCPAPEAPNYHKRIFLIPPLMLLSVGISINNSIAAFRGLIEAQRHGVYPDTKIFSKESARTGGKVALMFCILKHG